MTATKTPEQSKLYHQFSHLYDSIFTPLFQQRIRSTIRSLEISPGARVLEVGVGTGLSLPAYPTHAHVVGIDLSDEMLAQARQKVEENDWDHVSLRRLNALQTGFPDGYFDYAMAFHVVSVVPSPQKLVQEMTRVTRTGGALVIINHFRSENPVVGPLVGMLNPLTRPLGWRTDLRLADVVEHAPLSVERRFKTSSRSLYTVLVARKL